MRHTERAMAALRTVLDAGDDPGASSRRAL
jgi:hypothetical protein